MLSMIDREYEIADIFYYSFAKADALYHFTKRQKAVAAHIMNCRTAEMGTYVYKCECGHEYITHCSCRDRMCPKCQGEAHHEWIEKIEDVVLDCNHLHVVITFPDCLNPIALTNKEHYYSLMFEVVSSVITTMCKNEKHLGAITGFTAILHTWGQQMNYHPHIHLAITAGGLTDDGEWKDAKRTKKGDVYLLPVKALAKAIKSRMLGKLRESYKKGLFVFDDKQFEQLMDKADNLQWICYCKEPFKGSRGVFAYIGNYTHRSAIANSRILHVDEDYVTYRFRDYADNSRQKEQTLTNEEFIRRFLMHTLAKGFVRIRHYGLYAVPNRKTKLAVAKAKINNGRKQKTPVKKEEKNTEEVPPVYKCPRCGGVMYRVNRTPLTKIEYLLHTYLKNISSVPP